MPFILASIVITTILRCVASAQASPATKTCSIEKAVTYSAGGGEALMDFSRSELMQSQTQAVHFVQVGAWRRVEKKPLLTHNGTKGHHSWQDKALGYIFAPDAECTIASSSFDWGVQMLLFFACMGSLLLKWHLEAPQRRLVTFALDVSQQVCAAGLYHLLNMLFAAFLSNMLGDHADACAMYWISFVIDTSIGTFCTCLLLWISRRHLGYESGNYYSVEGKDIDAHSEEATLDNFDGNKWARQIMAFCGIICTSKLITSTLVFSALTFWSRIGIACTEWIDNPQLRLLWVMMITPAVMDTLTFWITDEFIKNK